MSDRYPILVEPFESRHAAVVVCERCHQEWSDWDPEDGDPYDLCIKHGNPTVASDCGGQIVFKYQWAERCKGCGKLDYEMPQALGGCCSRVCQFQADYAESLKARTP